MIVSYELEVRVKPTARGAYLEWLPGHTARVLESPGFLSAEVLGDDEDVIYVRYHVLSEEHLEDYLVNRAPALRAEGEKLFAGQFEIRRKVLEHRASYGAKR